MPPSVKFRGSPGGTAADSHDHHSSLGLSPFRISPVMQPQMFSHLRTKLNKLALNMAVLAELTPCFFLANMKCRQSDTHYLEQTANPRFSRFSPICVGRRSKYDGFVGAPSSSKRRK